MLAGKAKTIDASSTKLMVKVSAGSTTDVKTANDLKTGLIRVLPQRVLQRIF